MKIVKLLFFFNLMKGSMPYKSRAGSSVSEAEGKIFKWDLYVIT